MNHTTHRAEVCTPPPAQGTLARNGVASYLTWAARSDHSAQLLRKLYCKRKDSAETDAIWEGYWALKCQAEEHISALRGAGGLLFWPQPAALQAARTLHADLTGGAP